MLDVLLVLGVHLVLVSKKEGGLSLCINFRKLNSVMAQCKFPMPFIEEILLSLVKSEHFSSLDMRWGYHQMA